MIKVTILYPKTPSPHFDFDYHLTEHMPKSIGRLGGVMQSITVERVLDPGPPGPPAAYHAVCTFVCESKAAFEAAFLPYMAELQGDTPDYTDSVQQVSITEIVLRHP